MQDFFSAASGLGFPVAVAGFLLFRIEGRMIKFTEVIEGKPSEGKIGLIGAIQENTKMTQEANRTTAMISKKFNEMIREIKNSNKNK